MSGKKIVIIGSTDTKGEELSYLKKKRSNREGSILYDPEEDQIFIKELKKNLNSPLDVEEVDCNLEDFDTAKALVEGLTQLMEKNNSG